MNQWELLYREMYTISRKKGKEKGDTSSSYVKSASEILMVTYVSHELATKSEVVKNVCEEPTTLALKRRGFYFHLHRFGHNVQQPSTLFFLEQKAKPLQPCRVS
jgi:hypothetical protein